MTTTRPVLDALIGRDAETERIDRMLERVTLEGAALTVSGAPGIGKSALVDRAADMATRRRMAVLRTAGVQAEAQLPLAGLHQLLQPVLDRVDDLSPPQRDALRAAFGETRADPPGTFMIALATLNLLSDVAARTPLAVIAEDAQWLDAPTCAVLSFVGRRVGSDRIVLLITSREGTETALDASDLPALRLGPLDAGSAATLLDAHAPHLTGATRLRLLTAAAAIRSRSSNCRSVGVNEATNRCSRTCCHSPPVSSTHSRPGSVTSRPAPANCCPSPPPTTPRWSTRRSRPGR